MAARDYYQVLGVAKTATAEEVRSAHRELARKHHPDRNPEDPKAEAKFKEIQGAYDVLGDKEKRARYDQLGHSLYESGGSKFNPNAWAAKGAGPGGAGNVDFDLTEFLKNSGFAAGGKAGENPSSFFEDVFTNFSGGSKKSRKSPRSAALPDLETTLEVPFLTAVQGGPYSFDLARGTGPTETIACALPPGAKTGDRLRVRGKGHESAQGQRGDLVVTLAVQPHPFFARIGEGRDLQLELPLTIAEAVLGTSVEVPTLEGRKALRVPPGTSGGQKLRVKGQGVPAHKDKPQGDLFVVVKVVVPKGADDRSRELIEEFAERNPQSPRDGLW